MSIEYQSDVWDLIDTWAQTETDEGAKAKLREQIRRFALTGRGEQTNSETTTQARARDAYEKLAPHDIVNLHAWMFAREWIDISIGELDDAELSFSEREDRIQRLRTDAMVGIWAERGFDGVVSLIAASDAPHAIGRCSAPSVTDESVAADGLRDCLTNNAHLGQKIDAFMQGFIWALDLSERETLLRDVASTATTSQKVRLLSCAPFDDKTWRLLDEQPQDVRDGYWREVTPRWNGQSDSEL